MGRFGKYSHLAGCECDKRFTCRQCLTLAGPTPALNGSPVSSPAVSDAPRAGDACSVCGGELGALGTLGSVVHLNCRQCGAHFYGQE